MAEEKEVQTTDADVESAESVQSEPEVKLEDGQEVVAEKSEGEAEKPEQKGVITDEQRKEYGIPDKFKDWKSVAAWGKEAEKAKSRAESEKGESEQKAKHLEELISNLSQKKKEEEGTGLSPDEKQKIRDKFVEEFNSDPLGTMNSLFNKFEQKLSARHEQEKMEKTWAEEEADLKKDPAYKDTWDSEVRPALAKIADEKPHLKTIGEALEVYEGRRAREDRFNKAESETKKTEKKAAFVERGAGGKAPSGVMDEIGKATTMEALEKLAGRV